MSLGAWSSSLEANHVCMSVSTCMWVRACYYICASVCLRKLFMNVESSILISKMHKNVNTYGHSSRSRDRTLEMCEPRLRWMPEHSIQINTPRFKLAQSGSGNNNKVLLTDPANLVRFFTRISNLPWTSTDNLKLNLAKSSRPRALSGLKNSN